MKIENRKMKKNAKQFKTMKNRPEVIMPILGMNEIGLPVLLATIGDKGLVFLLDTGADSCFLDERVYRLLENDLQKFEIDGTIIGMGDVVHEKKTGAGMKFKVNGHPFEAKFDVTSAVCSSFDTMEKMHGLRVHGILGVNFMAKNNLILDFANGKICRKRCA